MITFKCAESVSDGHPDKIADQISDAIVDASLELNPNARVAVETMIKNQTIVISGEMSSIRRTILDKAVKKALSHIGFCFNDYQIFYNLSHQSQELQQQIGAQDQCIAIGYACNDNPEYMPAAILIAHQLMISYREWHTTQDWLLPDGKAQVIVEYSRGVPIKVHSVTLTVQHDGTQPIDMVKDFLLHNVIIPTIGYKPLYIYINLFIQGGTEADCGVTGRKLMVDTYGPAVAHGGGAFSGKDPTKMDRTGAYMARFLAKQVVSAGRASKCQVTLVYTPGEEHPIHVDVETFSTGIISDAAICRDLINKHDLTPSGIIKFLKLDRPIYFHTASFGHFGRKPINQFPWEKI